MVPGAGDNFPRARRAARASAATFCEDLLFTNTREVGGSRLCVRRAREGAAARAPDAPGRPAPRRRPRAPRRLPSPRAPQASKSTRRRGAGGGLRTAPVIAPAASCGRVWALAWLAQGERTACGRQAAGAARPGTFGSGPLERGAASSHARGGDAGIWPLSLGTGLAQPRRPGGGAKARACELQPVCKGPPRGVTGSAAGAGL